MPITKQAIKKLRHDRRRERDRERVRRALRKVIKEARTRPTKKTVSSAFTALDKATKKHIVHKNKAARIKSRITKLLKK